ncbi:MAG TPA: cytochrome c oxidase subunit II transmembrane domain-containing protein [Chitinophagales bacterium]|nr:cytochrome c oxidase subunit II transmembrane domain-containing protein [Chitinophagales bacterium]
MTGWLIFIAIALVLIVLYQVTRTLDIVSQLRGQDDENVEDSTKVQSIGLLIFMILGLFGFFWSFGHFKNTNIAVASEHGELIERMFIATLIVTGAVFVITNILLFTFVYIYRYRRGREADHFAHSNKLELIWTVIPTIVLTGFVVFGLQSWTKITGKPSSEAIVFEVTGQQFFWSVRYPGADGVLGLRDYNLICADNPVGIVTKEFIQHKIAVLSGNPDLGTRGEIGDLESRKAALPALIANLQTELAKRPNRYKADDIQAELKKLQDELDDIDEHIIVRQKNLERIELKYTDAYLTANASLMKAGYDDLMPSQIHLPVNKEALAKITALDVLHDFYVPHMKVKMDAVPGMPTSFKFTPTLTTSEMRDILSSNPIWQKVKDGDTDPVWKSFNYEVACAELCGTGHSAMKFIMVIDTEPEYEKWLSEQVPYWDNVAGNLKISKLSSDAPVKKSEEPVQPAEPKVDSTTADSSAAVTVKN